MKRDSNLQTLSWEHHDGLVLVFRIDRGLKNRTKAGIIRLYLLHAWEVDLTHHFWQEEEILPAILEQSEEGKFFLARMLKDHKDFEKRISVLNRETSKLKENLEIFAQKLNDHIRFEERQLFPFIERNANENEINRIGMFLHTQHHTGKKCWEPAFWR